MKRAETLIIGAFLLLLLGVGGYYFATTGPRGPHANPERSITFVLPSVTGLAPGQMISSSVGTPATPGGVPVGYISSIEPVAGGALVTVSVEAGVTLYRGSRAVLRPATPPQPSMLEISAALATAEPLELPAEISAAIELGAPEGMIEPTPSWPAES